MGEGSVLTVKTEQYIRSRGLLQPGEGVIIGLSGGADSVCLLHVLRELQEDWRLRLYAVHVHHGIRKEGADADMAYAEALCRRLEIPFFSYCVDVPAMAKDGHLSEEEAGRKARYRAFAEVMEQTESSVIAVAHHMDDLAETVLMNLLRGSGIRGSAGILPMRPCTSQAQRQGRIIRPLLCLEKSEITAWLEERGIAWQTDETNCDNDYLRNRIRNCLLPQLQREYNAQAAAHLAAAAGEFREADEYLAGQAAGLLKQWLTGGNERECILPAGQLRAQPHIIQTYVLRQAIGRLTGLRDIGRRHIEDVLGLLEGSGARRLMLPGGIRARVSYDSLILAVGDETPVQEEYQAVFSIFPYQKEKKIPQSCCVNWFDYDKIKNALLMRTRRQKDRICVIADGGRQKLSDYMINRKIPAGERDRLRLLASGQEILWIPGYRMAEDYKVTETTRLVLQVQLRSPRDKS